MNEEEPPIVEDPKKSKKPDLPVETKPIISPTEETASEPEAMTRKEWEAKVAAEKAKEEEATKFDKLKARLDKLEGADSEVDQSPPSLAVEYSGNDGLRSLNTKDAYKDLRDPVFK